jgi:hypothetical protein
MLPEPEYQHLAALARLSKAFVIKVAGKRPESVSFHTCAAILIDPACCAHLIAELVICKSPRA